jgi:hypothetical protein
MDARCVRVDLCSVVGVLLVVSSQGGTVIVITFLDACPKAVDTQMATTNKYIPRRRAIEAEVRTTRKEVDRTNQDIRYASGEDLMLERTCDSECLVRRLTI